jgi:hypothetical protein
MEWWYESSVHSITSNFPSGELKVNSVQSSRPSVAIHGRSVLERAASCARHYTNIDVAKVWHSR